MEIFRGISNWLTWQRRKRQWRSIRTLLVLALICILFNCVSLACGVALYTLQRIGLLPEAQEGGDDDVGQLDSGVGVVTVERARYCRVSKIALENGGI